MPHIEFTNDVRSTPDLRFHLRKVLLHTTRQSTHDGGDRPVIIERWIVDRKLSVPLLPGTPIFANIADDETVRNAYGRYNLVREQIEVAEAEASFDDTECDIMLEQYGEGDVTIVQVQAAAATREAAYNQVQMIKSSITGARNAVIEARRAAMETAMREFHAAVKPIEDERKVLEARLAELSGFHNDILKSFSLTSGHPNKEFNLSGNALDRAIDRYLHDGLEMPSPVRLTENVFTDNR